MFFLFEAVVDAVFGGISVGRFFWEELELLAAAVLEVQSTKH